ncbi:MAG: chemotaxis response regulator protein-glutamate methylesterase, partial [Alphaproteobacteria bacterium]
MVVDDSAVIRTLITRILEEDSRVRVVATAGNGQIALDILSANDIDVVILDIEMPVMDGLTALPKLLRADPGVKIIMASTLSTRNADISIRALQAGAADYVPKPTSASDIRTGDEFRRELLTKVKTLGEVRRRHRSTARGEGPPPGPGPSPAKPIALRKPGPVRPEVLAIGSSTGGPKALFAVLGGLKSTIRQPILITQHMPPTFTTILAEHIARASGRPCAEAKDGEVVEWEHIYVAPGDFHMVVEANKAQQVFRLSEAPPENFCRPTVDPMLRSLAKVFGPGVLSVILTGMGNDGLDGGEAVAKAGGTVIAQDEKSSVVWGMPGAVATAGLCSAVLPIT